MEIKNKLSKKEQLVLEELQYENDWEYGTFKGRHKFVVWLIKILNSCLNYFNYTANINKLRKNPEMVDIELRSIKGVKRKENLSTPTNGWSSLESSLETYGYDPEQFEYIQLNKENIPIDGSHRLCLLNIKHRNPFYKVRVVVWDVDVSKSNIMVTKRRLIWNSIIILGIITLILLLV